MKTHEFDLIFSLSVGSSVLIFLFLLFLFRGFSTLMILLPLAVAMYVPVQYYALYLFLKQRQQLQTATRKDYSRKQKQSASRALAAEIALEKEKLADAHLQLEAQLESFQGSQSLNYATRTTPEFCENLLVNALLCAKKQQAEQLGISFSASAAIHRECALPEDVLVSLFSNLLDNGIESAANCTDKIIEIKISQARNLLQIEIMNSTRPDKKVLLKSSSKNSWKHGFGMKIISGILKDYHGSYICFQDENLFKQKIQLTLPEPAPYVSTHQTQRSSLS